MGFLSLIIDPITSWLKGRAEKQRIKAEAELALVQAQVEAKIAKAKAEAEIELKKATADIDWEQTWAQQASKSWKDEYWTIILSLPAILVFIPPMRQHVAEGFVALDQTVPEWYIVALLSAIGAAFGLRALTKFTRK